MSPQLISERKWREKPKEAKQKKQANKQANKQARKDVSLNDLERLKLIPSDFLLSNELGKVIVHLAKICSFPRRHKAKSG